MELPVEIWLRILSKLTFKSLICLQFANKVFSEITTQDSFWQKFYDLHFADVEENGNGWLTWKQKFAIAYNDTYAELPPKKRKLFTLLNESDAQGLRKMRAEGLLKFEDINPMHKPPLTLQNDEGLLSIAVKNYRKNQAILDLFYSMVLEAYTEQKKGINEGDITLLAWAAQCNQNQQVIDLAAQGYDLKPYRIQHPPLLLAVQNDYIEMAKTLIDCGAKFTATNGATHMGAAVDYASDEMVQFLIENKAPIDEDNDDWCHPLHGAVSKESIKKASLLLKAGADVNAIMRRNQDTSLSAAVKEDLIEMAKLLIAHGAKVDLPADAEENITPLFIAISRGYTNMVQVLLEANANLYASNTKGVTPLMEAEAKGKATVLSVIYQHMLTKYIQQQKLLLHSRYTGNFKLFDPNNDVLAERLNINAAEALLHFISGEKTSESLKPHYKIICSNPVMMSILRKSINNDVVSPVVHRSHNGASFS